jgi:hypothetical protein
MAAANESQGLKIAVAVFVTLTVILAVATYFSYTAYSQADARFNKAESDKETAKRAASDALTQVENLRKEIGVKAEDSEAIKTEIKGEYKKIDEELNSLVAQSGEMITKAQAAGASGPELDDLKNKVQQIAASYRSEPNKTYISANARLVELLKNLSLLTTQVSLNYTDRKRNLESANNVNAQKLKVETDELTKSKTDLSAEHDKHESERQGLLGKVDQYQSDNSKMQAEIANLNAKIRKMEEDYSKSLSLAQQNIREYRDRLEQKETVLERPDGVVTYVDYNRGEIHANLTRGTGARPQMQFSIFDSSSPGLPTDKPKGTVELTSVGDRESIARITKTNNHIEPIRVGDFVYSAAWSPNDPMRFALIGRIDINRDGRDDRADLKRMIEAAGGIVDYDLPPPDAGKESGKLTGRDAWYVTDTRMALREMYGSSPVTANENTEFLKKQSEAIREARLNGVRPMPIERLLPYLGYDFAAPVRGRAEAVDTQTLKRVLAPRQEARPKPDAAKEEAPKEEAPKEDMPKEEKK